MNKYYHGQRMKRTYVPPPIPNPEPIDEHGWDYDAYDYIHESQPFKAPPGRPNCLRAGVFTLEGLRATYERTHSVRRTGNLLGISPTTVKKYLRGELPPPGRPLQPKAWAAQYRTSIHAWFVEHKNEQLPRTTHELAKLSGFTTRQISKYLSSRRDAMLSYLQSLPPINSLIIIFRDVDGNKVPSNLIRDYVYTIDRFTGAVTISCVLTMSGQRILMIPFRELESALRGKNPSLPTIGLAFPLKPPPKYSPYKPRWSKDTPVGPPKS